MAFLRDLRSTPATLVLTLAATIATLGASALAVEQFESQWLAARATLNATASTQTVHVEPVASAPSNSMVTRHLSAAAVKHNVAVAYSVEATSGVVTICDPDQHFDVLPDQPLNQCHPKAPPQILARASLADAEAEQLSKLFGTQAGNPARFQQTDIEAFTTQPVLLTNTTVRPFGPGHYLIAGEPNAQKSFLSEFTRVGLAVSESDPVFTPTRTVPVLHFVTDLWSGLYVFVVFLALLITTMLATTCLQPRARNLTIIGVTPGHIARRVYWALLSVLAVGITSGLVIFSAAWPLLRNTDAQYPTIFPALSAGLMVTTLAIISAFFAAQYLTDKATQQ